MRLLRLAVLELSEDLPEFRKWTFSVDGVEVGTLLSWEREGRVNLLIAAQADLEELPEINVDGYLVAPDDLREKVEESIEVASNFVGVAARCLRRISSPVPYLAFVASDDSERAYLDTARGLLLPDQLISMPSYRVPIEDALKYLSNRPDGAALLAEALAQDHAVGRFREFQRFFERAFACDAKKLAKQLASFLAGSSGGFTDSEIKGWIVTMRGRTIHADKGEEFFLERDVRAVVHRMEEAAYDVLFNKAKWRCDSAERRKALQPPTGTTSAAGGIFIVKGTKPALGAQFLDAFGSYPLNLNVCLSSELTENWYCKSSSWQPEAAQDAT
jgi:hypothetical protein